MAFKDAPASQGLPLSCTTLRVRASLNAVPQGLPFCSSPPPRVYSELGEGVVSFVFPDSLLFEVHPLPPQQPLNKIHNERDSGQK